MSRGDSRDGFVRFRVVFFDLGSTLIYFDGNWNEVLEQAAQALGESLTYIGVEANPKVLAVEFSRRLKIYYEKREKDLVEHTTEFVLRDLLDSLGYTNPHEDVIRTGLDTFYATFHPHWRAEEDAHSTLASLKGVNYRLGLISNAGDVKDVQTLVDRFSLRPFFDHIIISAKVGVRKPHPRIFEIALDTFNVHPNEAVMVGDELPHDILGANNTGIASIWVTRRADMALNKPYRTRVYPEEVISSLSEIPSLLSNW